MHVQNLRDACRPGGPVECARLAIGTAELSRARGCSYPAEWLRAAQRWDAIARPYQAAIARWRAADALIEHGDRPGAIEAALHGSRIARELGSRWLVDEIMAVADRSELHLGQATRVHKAVG